MLNTRDLEKRWLKYKIKSYIPHVIITLSIILITTSALFFVSSEKQTEILAKEYTELEIPQQQTIATIKTKPIEAKQTDIKDAPSIASVMDTEIKVIPEPMPQTNKRVVLQPSLDFMKKIQDSSDGYYKKTPKVQTFDTAYVAPQTIHKKKEPKTTNTAVDVEEVVVEETPVTTQKAKKIVIARETSIEDIKDAEKRFKKNNNPALSLFLAKQYYARGDYSKSYNYALITNQLDKDNEDSWLIFSRSLVKLGKTKLAKKALNEYIKFSHSSNAELLLDDITTGKFQ